MIIEMKKIFAIMAAVVCLWGCEKNEIFTPMTVTLASEGQTMTVETTIQPQTLDILDYDGFRLTCKVPCLSYPKIL